MRRLLLTGLIFAMVGCGGSDGDPAGPDDNNGNLPNGSMSARIDGSSWTATSAIAATYTGGIVAIAGSSTSFTTIGFAAVASGPGTYAIGPTSPTNGLLTEGTAGATWHASSAHTGSSGSITITSLSATGAAGTFTFSMVADGTSGSSGTRTITNGTFNVTF